MPSKPPTEAAEDLELQPRRSWNHFREPHSLEGKLPALSFPSPACGRGCPSAARRGEGVSIFRKNPLPASRTDVRSATLSRKGGRGEEEAAARVPIKSRCDKPPSHQPPSSAPWCRGSRRAPDRISCDSTARSASLPSSIAAAVLLHAHDARVVDGVERQRFLRGDRVLLPSA